MDSTARRSAALARALDGCETGGKTIETVTWAAVDEGGNVQVAVTNSPAAAPSGGTTAEVVNGSGGHVISDGVWNLSLIHISSDEGGGRERHGAYGGKKDVERFDPASLSAFHGRLLWACLLYTSRCV